MEDMHKYTTHPNPVRRLKRAEGHLRHVIEMIEGGKTYLSIACQLAAVESAATAARCVLTYDHTDHCLFHDENFVLAEMKTLIKPLWGHPVLPVLNNRTYCHLFTAQAIVLVGTDLMTVTLGLLAYELAGADTGAVFGTALAIRMLAYAGVVPVAQVFVDRLPRRSLFVALDLV